MDGIAYEDHINNIKLFWLDFDKELPNLGELKTLNPDY